MSPTCDPTSTYVSAINGTDTTKPMRHWAPLLAEPHVVVGSPSYLSNSQLDAVRGVRARTITVLPTDMREKCFITIFKCAMPYSSVSSHLDDPLNNFMSLAICEHFCCAVSSGTLQHFMHAPPCTKPDKEAKSSGRARHKHLHDVNLSQVPMHSSNAVISRTPFSTSPQSAPQPFQWKRHARFPGQSPHPMRTASSPSVRAATDEDSSSIKFRDYLAFECSAARVPIVTPFGCLKKRVQLFVTSPSKLVVSRPRAALPDQPQSQRSSAAALGTSVHKWPYLQKFEESDESKLYTAVAKNGCAVWCQQTILDRFSRTVLLIRQHLAKFSRA